MPFFLPPGRNADMMAGAGATILYHNVTLGQAWKLSVKTCREDDRILDTNNHGAITSLRLLSNISKKQTSTSFMLV